MWFGGFNYLLAYNISESVDSLCRDMDTPIMTVIHVYSLQTFKQFNSKAFRYLSRVVFYP